MKKPEWLKGRFYIPDSLLKKHNFYELYPLDGGGSFIFDELAGTRDDRKLARLLVSGKLLKKWEDNGELNWKKHSKMSRLELHCFLHRLYFLVPLCKMYRLTKNEKYAELFFNILSSWEKSTGIPETKEEFIRIETNARDSDRRLSEGNLSSPDEPCDWEWYDFQPAQRLIVLVWSLYFLLGSKALDKHQAELYRVITLHASTIYWAVTEFELVRGNHLSLRMMALYITSVMIEHADSGKWRKTALKIQLENMALAFHKDGIIAEGLPGYAPFIITHFRDILLCASANGQKLPGAFKATVLRSVTALKAMLMPDGFLPVINDGPRVRLEPVTELMQHYFPRELKELDRTVSENPAVLSGFGIFRDRKNYLIIDSNYAESDHVQAGKLGIMLWRGREPFIIEAGCCSYDHPDFQPYYRRGWAHSTLLVNGMEDGVLKSFWVRAERARPEVTRIRRGSRPLMECSSDGFKRLGIGFKRTVLQEDADTFVIIDNIKNNSKSNRFTFRFMTYDKKLEFRDKNTVRLKGRDSILEISVDNSPEIKITELKTNLFSREEKTKTLDYEITSDKDFKQIFRLKFFRTH
jgi:hypothetical protein